MKRLLVILILSAAVYSQDLPTSWIQAYKLTSPDPTGTDSYAKGVAIDGNTAVVGALGSTVNGWLGTGAAYVYVDGQQVAKLTPSDAGGNLNFGASVGISGDTIVVGARGGVNKKVWTHGGMYIFQKPADGWQDASETLKIDSSGGRGYYGYLSVAIEGQLAFLGFPRGGVTVFDGSQGWAQVASIPVNLYSMAVSNGTIVVGDPEYLNSMGAIHVYQNFTQVSLLTPSDGAQDELGMSVSISDQTIVGSVNDGYGTEQIGKAYVYLQPLQGWQDATESVQLTGVHNNCQCEPIATDGLHVVTAGLSGHALVYNRGKAWTNRAKANGSLKMGNPYLTDAVAMQQNLAIVGSFNYHHPGGAVVFTTGQ